MVYYLHNKERNLWLILTNKATFTNQLDNYLTKLHA